MIKYIEKLQSKDEVARKQILVSSLVVCMSFVGVVWISTFGYKFNNDKKVEVAKEEKASGPFALLGQTISDTYKNVTASVGNIPLLKKDKTEIVDSGKQIDLVVVEKE